MPTGYTPIYRVYKDGNDVTGRFNDRSISIEVELFSGGGEGDRCQISVDDRDWRVAHPYVGDKLEIYLGYQEVGLAFMGQFEIDEVVFLGPPKTIAIRGFSTGLKGQIKAPVIQHFENKNLGEILEKLARDAGLDSEIHEQFKHIKIPFKNQAVSAMHLIHEFERQFGAVAKVANGRLIFAPRDAGVTTSGVEIPILTLLPEHFGTWRVRHGIRAEYGSIVTSYFDKDTWERKTVTEKPGSDIGGSLHDAPDFIDKRVFNSKAEAEAAAKARMQTFRRSMGDFYGTLAKGDPWIRDQQRLQVTGMRDGIDGSYVIQSVKHTYVKESGILSEIQATPNGQGADYSNMGNAKFLKPNPGELMGEALQRLPSDPATAPQVGQAPRGDN